MLPGKGNIARAGLSILIPLCSICRVLIHAAAGGVGLAAIQVLQEVKATILATAGAPAKRGMLRYVSYNLQISFQAVVKMTILSRELNEVFNNILTQISILSRFMGVSHVSSSRDLSFVDEAVALGAPTVVLNTLTSPGEA